MKYLNRLVGIFRSNGIPMNQCSMGDLKKVNQLTGGVKLPEAYIEFLQVMGNGTNNIFLRGHSCFMDELLELNEWGIELLEENKVPEKLTPNDFVFWMSQGCLFCFFKLNEGENPSVYFYSERKKQDGFYKITETFTEFLERMYKKDQNIFHKKFE